MTYNNAFHFIFLLIIGILSPYSPFLWPRSIYAVLVTGMQVYGNAKSLSPDLTQARLAAAKLIELFDTPGTIDSSSAEGFTPVCMRGSLSRNAIADLRWERS